MFNSIEYYTQHTVKCTQYWAFGNKTFKCQILERSIRQELLIMGSCQTPITQPFTKRAVLEMINSNCIPSGLDKEYIDNKTSSFRGIAVYNQLNTPFYNQYNDLSKINTILGWGMSKRASVLQNFRQRH